MASPTPGKISVEPPPPAHATHSSDSPPEDPGKHRAKIQRLNENDTWWEKRWRSEIRDNHESALTFFWCYLSVILPCWLAGFDQNILASLSTEIGNDLQQPKLIAFIAAFYNVFQTAAIPFAGALTNLYGRKVVALAGMLMFVLGNVLCGLAYYTSQSPAGLVLMALGRIIAGSAASVLYMTPMSITTDYYHNEEDPTMTIPRRLYNSVNVVIAGIGQGCGSFLSIFISTKYSWGVIFFGVAALTAACLVLCFEVAFETHTSCLSSRKDRAVRTCSREVDIPGCIALSLGLALLLSGLSLLGTVRPYRDPLALILMIVGGLLCVCVLPLIYLYHKRWNLRYDVFFNNDYCKCMHKSENEDIARLLTEHTKPAIDFKLIRKSHLLIVIIICSLFTICGYNVIYYYIPFYFRYRHRGERLISLYLIGPAAASAVFAIPAHILTSFKKLKGYDIQVMMCGAAMQVIFAGLIIPGVMYRWRDADIVVFASLVVGASDLIGGGATNQILISTQAYIHDQKDESQILFKVYCPEWQWVEEPSEEKAKAFTEFVGGRIREHKVIASNMNKMAGRLGLAAAAPLAGLVYNAKSGSVPTEIHGDRATLDMAYVAVFGLIAGTSSVGVLMPLVSRAWRLLRPWFLEALVVKWERRVGQLKDVFKRKINERLTYE